MIARTALGCPQAALKPALLENLNKASMRAVTQRVFQFEAVPVANPKKNIHEVTCISKFGGICCTDAFAQMGRLFTANLWAQLNDHKFKKETSYPLILDVDIRQHAVEAEQLLPGQGLPGEVKRTFLLLDIVGKGDLAVLCDTVVVGGGPGVSDEVLEPPVAAAGHIQPMSAHRALSIWMHDVSQDVLPGPDDHIFQEDPSQFS